MRQKYEAATIVLTNNNHIVRIFSRRGDRRRNSFYKQLPCSYVCLVCVFHGHLAVVLEYVHRNSSIVGTIIKRMLMEIVNIQIFLKI